MDSSEESSDADLQSQIEEIEALSSIYGEEWCVIDEASRVFCIRISDDTQKPTWTVCLQRGLAPGTRQKDPVQQFRGAVCGEYRGEYSVPLGGENKGIPRRKITKCRTQRSTGRRKLHMTIFVHRKKASSTSRNQANIQGCCFIRPLKRIVGTPRSLRKYTERGTIETGAQGLPVIRYTACH
ncbi:hypothetical protein PO909_027748 [Leuciscus waleckii]